MLSIENVQEKTDRAICILCQKGKKKTDSKRNAGFQPISIPLLSCHSHLVPKTQGSSSIKLMRKQKNPEKQKNRKTKDFVQAQEKITKSTP